MRSARSKPLEGVRVLEFCEFAAGPFAGSLLADLGADVVKVAVGHDGLPGVSIGAECPAA